MVKIFAYKVKILTSLLYYTMLGSTCQYSLHRKCVLHGFSNNLRHAYHAEIVRMYEVNGTVITHIVIEKGIAVYEDNRLSALDVDVESVTERIMPCILKQGVVLTL